MIDKEKLIKKIEATENGNYYPNGYAERISNFIMDRCIPELEQNVNEWSDDKPLTDIIVGDGWSINRILKEYPWIDFIQALFVLYYYKEGGYYSPDFANLFFKK